MIVTIIYSRKSLIINTLNGIIWLYDNKDKQDKQNMSYWKEIIILCYSFRSLGLFPNRVGSEAVINGQPKLFDEWTCNYRQQDYCDGRLGHHILAVRSVKSFRV
jgi:hypothetical protein